MQEITVSAKDSEDLISEFFTDDYCFAITKKNELIYWPTESEPIWEIECLEEPELIDEFEIMLEPPLILLNDFMSENYPEINVETQFITNKKGVFQRFREYNEKIYYEFQEYKQRIMYDKLSEYLKNNGFELIYK